MFEFKVEVFSQDWKSQFEFGYFSSKQNLTGYWKGLELGLYTAQQFAHLNQVLCVKKFGYVSSYFFLVLNGGSLSPFYCF